MGSLVLDPLHQIIVWKKTTSRPPVANRHPLKKRPPIGKKFFFLIPMILYRKVEYSP
jgi:hypothetical protein